MTNEAPINFEAQDRLRMIVSRTKDLTPLKAAATKAIAMAGDERAAAMDLATVEEWEHPLLTNMRYRVPRWCATLPQVVLAVEDGQFGAQQEVA